jgi:hypothetical protein
VTKSGKISGELAIKPNRHDIKECATCGSYSSSVYRLHAQVTLSPGKEL